MSVAESTVGGVSSGPFTARAGLLMALVGVFAFCALAVLSVYAPELRGGRDGGAHALSKSAVGYGAIAEAMTLDGDNVVINRGPLTAGRSAGLMVVTPSPLADEGAVTALGFAGPTLIVLPKWLAPMDPQHPGWVGKGTPIPTGWLPKSALMADSAIARAKGSSRLVLRAVSAPFTVGSTLNAGPIDQLQTFSPKGWQAVLIDQTGAVVLARDPQKPIYLLSDPDLLNTQGVRDIDTLGSAISLLHTLRNGSGPIIFDVRLNGFGRDRNAWRLLFEPPFLAVTLCLAVAAALAGFQAVCRFGPMLRPARPLALGKTALVDNSAALIRLAGREHRLGGRYANLIRDIVARAVGAPRDLNGDALIAFLDRLAETRGARDRLGLLGAQARGAADRERLLATARKLFQWKLEMTRERW